MDKNSLLGFLLMAAVIFGFMYINKPSEEELAAERERQEAAGETPRYINEFLGMSEEEKAAYIAEREAKGIIPTVPYKQLTAGANAIGTARRRVVPKAI